MSELKRVLFVCVGNACRSQMAEAFARVYGPDVIIPASAGLSPAGSVAPDTVRAMDEKNLNVRDHFPKSIGQLGRAEFDLVVNMSGEELPRRLKAPVKEWDVPDPVSLSFDDHCRVRDRVEDLVMRLILELRREANDLARPRPKDGVLQK